MEIKGDDVNSALGMQEVMPMQDVNTGGAMWYPHTWLDIMKLITVSQSPHYTATLGTVIVKTDGSSSQKVQSRFIPHC